jgi:adenylylsulfate kinase
MAQEPENIYPEFARMQNRTVKEVQLRQTSHLFWLYGLSGSGKSTLANALERALTAEGYVVKLLDGDNVRTGLNRDLGFSDADRTENIRRIAEVAKLFLDAGIIVIASFITPLRALRESVVTINGAENTHLIYAECDFETCAKRDVKGLYAKAATGKVQHFTGKDSAFEAPSDSDSDWRVRTDKQGVMASIAELLQEIRPLLKHPSGTARNPLP